MRAVNGTNQRKAEKRESVQINEKGATFHGILLNFSETRTAKWAAFRETLHFSRIFVHLIIITAFV